MNNGDVRIRRALISVTNKTGIVPFAQQLVEFGVEIVSTGGTAKELKAKGIPVVDISDFTGFPEMLDGRVKTLHPMVHGGILFKRGNPEHEETIKQFLMHPIDMVVVNLYRFEDTVAKPGCTFQEAIENIDIGGPSMIRSAAKNQASVTVVTSPSQYDMILCQMQNSGGCIGQKARSALAAQAFLITGAYDRAIAAYLTNALL